jgi:hypothetical protein
VSLKGLLLFATGFIFLPGSVYVLLAANFGALKGYLIAAVAFFGFLVMLSATWAFGLPGTTALTGPKGTEPAFKEFTREDPVASRFPKVDGFQGAAGNGWNQAPAEPAPGAKLSPADEELKADLDTARQAAVQKLITERNKNVKDSSKELDVTNLDAKSFWTEDGGTVVAATVISPKAPPEGSGLQRPNFAPVTDFAYKDPGAPLLPSYLFLGGSALLFAVHLLLLQRAERRRPLGTVLTPGAEAPARTPARV